VAEQSQVLVEREGAVAIVTLNDPERRNALNSGMVDEIVAAFDEIEADEGIGAVVITGAGRGFCAGADLGNLETAGDGSVRQIYEGFLRVGRCPLPTVAAVNGAAVGAGMNLALVADIRLAATSARFITRFVDLGLHPGGGHTWMLRRAVGEQTAMAMLLGQTLDGPEAERRGLVWRCVDDDQLMSEAIALAARAAEGPRELVIAVKDSVRRLAHTTDHDEAVDHELDVQLWSFQQPWFAERLAALQAQITSSR
jgi:enoyl-CoA hydratase